MEDILDKPHQDEVFCRPINNKICSTSNNIKTFLRHNHATPRVSLGIFDQKTLQY